ncbi:MAG: acetyl-CoA carboxylase biotin carboxylase subunit, partial [Terriglobales bacterium]
RRALDEYFVGGIKTNLPLFRRILDHPDFVAGHIDTGFLDRLLAMKPVPASGANRLADIAAVSAALFAAAAPQKSGRNGGDRIEAGPGAEASAWKRTARSEGIRNE